MLDQELTRLLAECQTLPTIATPIYESSATVADKVTKYDWLQ